MPRRMVGGNESWSVDGATYRGHARRGLRSRRGVSADRPAGGVPWDAPPARSAEPPLTDPYEWVVCEGASAMESPIPIALRLLLAFASRSGLGAPLNQFSLPIANTAKTEHNALPY